MLPHLLPLLLNGYNSPCLDKCQGSCEEHKRITFIIGPYKLWMGRGLMLPRGSNAWVSDNPSSLLGTLFKAHHLQRRHSRAPSRCVEHCMVPLRNSMIPHYLQPLLVIIAQCPTSYHDSQPLPPLPGPGIACLSLFSQAEEVELTNEYLRLGFDSHFWHLPVVWYWASQLPHTSNGVIISHSTHQLQNSMWVHKK